MRIPAEHIDRLRHEIGEGVDVVETRRAVAIVDHRLDPADIEPRSASDPLRCLDQMRRRLHRSHSHRRPAGLRDAGIVRYSSEEELRSSISAGTVPESPDKVLLVQDYVPARGGTIIRLETLGGRFLYAIEIESGGESFDLCPADACLAQPGRAALRMTSVTPAQELIEAAERIAQAAGLDVGGIEVVIDDRDGVPRFYDINALSNFVADPMNVLGWDPHERLVDYIEAAIEGMREE